MVTIREYYDLFRRYAPQKSDKDFADQALMVGYSQQDVDSVVQLKSSVSVASSGNSSQSSTTINRIQVQPLASVLSKPTNSVSTPVQAPTQSSVPTVVVPRMPERPLPPLVVRPSSYVARNQIGVSTPGTPSGLKSFSYNSQPVAAPTIIPASKVPASPPNGWPTPKPMAATPNFSPTTSIPNLPGAMPVDEHLPNGPISLASQSLKPSVQSVPVQPIVASSSSLNSSSGINMNRVVNNIPPPSSSPLDPVLRSDFTPGSSINMINRPKVDTPKVAVPIMTMANQAPTDAARIITRAPLPEHPIAFKSSGGSKWSLLKIILIMLLVIVLVIGGITAYMWYPGGLKKNLDNILSDAAPYQTANVLSSVLQKLVLQKDIPYVAQVAVNIQDKGNSPAFASSAYQKNPAFARDTKKVDDLNKIRDLLAKNFAVKKKYPKTLKEIGFATLDPNGKAYAYLTNQALTTYKIAVDFETSEMINNIQDSLPKVAASSSKITFTQSDVGEILVFTEPFDDMWNDWLTFSSKIASLPKRLNINTNISGNLNKSASVPGDNALSVKGPISYNNTQKPIDLQLVNHSGVTSVKSNYLDKWVLLDGEQAPVNLSGLIKEVIQSSVDQGVWAVKEPVREQVVLSNQLSVDSFRYDLTLKNIALDSFLSGLKDRLVKGNLIDVATADKIAFVTSHKDTRALGNYLGSITSAHIWIDQKGEPLKLEILLGNISGRASLQRLNVDLLLEFGQGNADQAFSLPSELSTNDESEKVVKLSTLLKDPSFTNRFLGVSSTVASSTETGSGTLSAGSKPKRNARRVNVLDLILPLRDIQDSIDKLKQSEVVNKLPTGSSSSRASSTPGNVGLMPPGGNQSQESNPGILLPNVSKTSSSSPVVPPKKQEPAGKPLPNRLF